MCWNILWRDALVIFRGFNYTSAFFLFFFFLQCETNPVDKLHSKDLVVVTLKNRKKKKGKKKKKEKCKKCKKPRKWCVRYVQVWCVSHFTRERDVFSLPSYFSLFYYRCSCIFLSRIPLFFLHFLFLFFFSNETINWEKVDSTNWHCSCGQSIDITVNRFEYINSIPNFDRSH